MKFVIAAAMIIASVISITVHEFAHAYSAHLCGDDTAKINGRMTLNPLAHMDIIGFILLVIVGFGWAKPVPVDTDNLRNRKRDSLFVFSSGVISNIVMCFVSMLILFLLRNVIIGLVRFDTGIVYLGYFLSYLLQYLMLINLMLAFFNILPIYPLDGFNILVLFSKRRNAYIDFMLKYGSFVLIGIILVSNILEYANLNYLNVFYWVRYLGQLLVNIAFGF
ncbi:MAG: site-2 protease family protein [Clostridia bacterium]|nr:site-2 protease family protein [Clostridia bacterium]